MKPIVWTIAGSDSSAGAGIQADLKTFADFGVHGCSIISAVTAQNSYGVQAIEATKLQDQIEALEKDLPPKVIKIGMQSNPRCFEYLVNFIKRQNCFVIYDPVIASSNHVSFFSDIQNLLPYVDLITPNLIEKKYLSLNSNKAIYLKGGHGNHKQFCHDYFCDNENKFWLTAKRLPHKVHGTGCVFSSAVAALIAKDYCLEDAVVIARMYLQQGIRAALQLGAKVKFFNHLGFPDAEQDLPYLSPKPLQIRPTQFQTCSELGLYPIVNSSSKILELAQHGIKTIQLRIKDENPEQEIIKSTQIARHCHLRLFINDYWQLALKHRAYGVHLGQTDLQTADIDLIRRSGLRLGISTHCFYEVARAHTINPSYIAIGPIFPTTSKVMPFAPQGIEKLIYWRKVLNYKLVAIGGINKSNVYCVQNSRVDGIAFISAINELAIPG